MAPKDAKAEEKLFEAHERLGLSVLEMHNDTFSGLRWPSILSCVTMAVRVVRE